VLVLCYPHSPAAAANDTLGREPAPGYRLEQLAAQLGDAPQELRADLARVVLSEMAAIYAAEAQQARRDARPRDADPDLRRWSAAVERLAQDLAALGDSVTDSTPIQATVNRDNSVMLLLDGRPVEIDGPRIDDQAGLERRVMERFCSLHPCDSLLSETLAREPIALAPETMPHWSFGGETGPVCSTGDGLELHFRSSDDLRRKREACTRVVTELNTLVAEIQRYPGVGAQLDWDALTIDALPGADRHRVVLSTAGDYFQAYLPALAATPDLMALVRPWLMAKVNGLEPQQVVIDAETLLPALGFLGQ
jgi:hypothetical protein